MGEGTSAGAARKFQQKGYTKVYALKGGWVEWSKGQYPTAPKK
jgi:rhodanese-related sulfurtransferase